MSKQTEALKLALKRAFNLGQTYWQQADSEYTSQWKKADVTLASFNQLVEDTIREALAESRSDEEQPAQQDSTCNKKLREQGKAYPRTCKKCGLGPCIADRVQPAPATELREQQELASASVEPVAEVRCDDGGNLTAHFYVRDLPLLSKLYTSPPIEATPLASQRSVKPWVGLTDEEQQAAYDAWQQKDDGWGSFYDLIEAKLREKNA